MTEWLASLARVPRSRFYLSATWIGLVATASILAFTSARVTHLDFVAFYCAGDAVANRADPYRQMPLYSCEYRVTLEGQLPYQTTVPAPLPPYAFPPFAALSSMPFGIAYAVFTSLSLLALAAGCAILGRVTGTGAMLLLAAITATAWDNIVKGQPVPFVFLAIALSGWALSRGRQQLAALAAAGTMVEPHIGLPICAALFLWLPNTRILLIVSAIVLGGVSVAAVPPSTAWSYLTVVLPLHAASETGWITQLSFVSPLVLFGVSTHTALALGMAQYALTASLGILIAALVASRLKAPECLAFLPPLFAVTGGTFIHNNLLLVAIPAGIFIVRRMRTATVYAALAAMALYWLAVSDVFEFAIIVVSVYTIVHSGRQRPVCASIAAGLIAMIAVAYHEASPVLKNPTIASHSLANAYAEDSWAAYTRAANPSLEGQLVAFVMKIPTWVGLLTLSALSIVLGIRVSSRGIETGVSRSRVLESSG